VVCSVADYADSTDQIDHPRKLSHITLNNGDPDATFACYRDALGFRLTDTTRRLRFLSCNADHHSVVLGFTGGPTLNHIAFEMPDLESVMRGAGRMRDDGRAIEWGPGRHGPGNNVFFYFSGGKTHRSNTPPKCSRWTTTTAPRRPTAGPGRRAGSIIGASVLRRANAWSRPAFVFASPRTAGGWTSGAKDHTRRKILR